MTELNGLATEQEIRAAQARYLGKKGRLAEPMKALGRLPAEDRPDLDVALEDWNAKEGLLAAIFIDFLRRTERRA